MIIRILGEGQFVLDDTHMADLNELDEQLILTDDANDDIGFALTLRQLLATVRKLGEPLADDRLAPSDLVLPAADTPLAEVRALLRDDGLIPG